ncbi:MAG: glycoside hydrolase family 9 protein [Gammaproteobacteria bacterium]
MRRFILVCAFLLHAPAWAAPVSQAIKLDHFGYRPNDSKIAIFSQNPGASVQLRDSADQVVFTIPPGSIQAKGYDGPPSGDTVWWVDFSAFTTPGTYRLFSPALASQSYDFTIALDVYNPVVLAALKTFYYQRCNTPKPAVYAGAWADPQACHLTDKTTTHAAGHADHGILDLGGGWHDAGDYNKYVWAAAANAIIGLLQAYEDNPGHFRDGDLNIPESGNGVPDILDEVKWELDWFLKMQLADGSVLYQTHVDGFASNAPPSADANVRYYQNPTLESGAVFAGSLALAARVYAAAGMTVYADQLKTAALKTWSWLQTQGDSEHKAWAAAEVFRTAGTASARAYVDGFHANQWAGVFFDPGHYDVHAAVTYLQAPGATAAVVNQMRADFAALVDRIFSVNDLYRNGIQDWSYHWGTNAIRAWYGIMLLNAAKLGATGGQSAAACRLHAQDFLHFFRP